MSCATFIISSDNATTKYLTTILLNMTMMIILINMVMIMMKMMTLTMTMMTTTLFMMSGSTLQIALFFCSA